MTEERKVVLEYYEDTGPVKQGRHQLSQTLDYITVGRLGAILPSRTTTNMNAALLAALDMAERRILRLEMSLRRAGIEVEETELPS